MIYTSTDNKYIKEIAKLKIKKYRDQSAYFLVEGKHLIEEAKKNGYLEKVFKLDDGYEIDVPICLVSINVLKYLSSLETPTIIGLCKKKNDEIKGDRILILDNIQNPGNLGTIIRSAVAFNIDTIVLSEDTVDLYNEKVVRATEGLLFDINIVRTNINQLVNELKEKNYKIYATKVNGGKSLKTLEKPSKFAIIMGNEGNGVNNSLLDICDEFLYIDMNGACESLNVGVATSIILYELDK